MAKLNLLDRFKHWRKKRRWDRQYKKGKWDYLNNEREASRYNKIVEYITLYSSKKPSVLDLGAGEAVLNERIKPSEYSAFMNVDYSDASIASADKKQLVNAENVVADIHTFNPSQEFDTIVFNEAFYYVHDNLRSEVLERFINKLSKDGLLICSIYKEGTGCWEYFDDNPRLKQLNFETVNTDRETTYWKVGAYRKLN